MTRELTGCLLLLAITAAFPRLAGGQNSAQKYDYLLKGFDDQRQRLRSGIYRATGRFYSEDLGLAALDGPVTIFSAFDFDAEKLRFDRTEPIREGKIITPSGESVGTWAKKVKGGKMIRLPERTISCDDDSNQVRIGTSTRMVELSVRPLDVRVFGTFYWADLVNAPSKSYQRLIEIYTREKPGEVSEAGRGIWKVTWNFPEDPNTGAALRRTLWIDEKSGFSPIRLEVSWRTVGMPAGVWPEPQLESETSWVEVGGVWVPRSTKVVNKSGLPRVQRYELAFDWEAVNRAVPDRIFTLEGLDLPKNDVVIDNSLGREIIVGHIGSDHKLVDAKVSAPPPPSPPRRAWRSWGPSSPYIAATMGLGALTLASWMRWRSSPRRGENP